MRARVMSGVVVSALVAGVLVATAPGADADVGDVTPFSLPSGAGKTFAMTTASTGDMWLGGTGPSLIRLTTDGVATSVPVAGLPANAEIHGIAEDSAGRIWFSEFQTDSLWSVTTNGGDPKRLQLPNAKSVPWGLTRGPDGNLWFAEVRDRVGRLTPAGALSEFDLPDGMAPFQVVGTPDGRILATGTATVGKAPNQVTTALVATVSTTGAISTAGPTGTAGIASTAGVTSDNQVWLPSKDRKSLLQTDLAGKLTGKSVGLGSTEVSDVTVGPDDAVWFISTDPSPLVGRIASGSVLATTFKISSPPSRLTVGADGNMWVASTGKSVYRVLSGITPVSSAAPTVSSPAGSSNGSGTVLTVTNGSWTFQPATFAQQWQRCTGNDPATCTDVPGANKPTYTVTDGDLGGFVRATITATNLNGAGKPASSGLFQVAAKPAAPVQPTTPTPVAGGATVTVTPGVVAKLTGPSSVKRKAKRTYRATFTAPQPRGTVRFSLLDKAGTEVYVIADAAGVKGGKKTATAAQTARIPRSVAKGSYTLRAVYTPAAAQASNYPIATLTKPLRLK